MTILYHFTCEHSARRIDSDQRLQPHAQPMLDYVPLVWLTDLEAVLDPGMLGLERGQLVTCDRLARRFAVAYEPHVERWDEYATRTHVPPIARQLLEAGRSPDHWYCTEQPIDVLRAQ